MQMMWYSSYDVDSMQHLLGVLEEFCYSSLLAVNVEKTKMMVMQTIQPHHYPMLTYRGEHIQFVRSFKYLGIDVPATNKWSAVIDTMTRWSVGG